MKTLRDSNPLQTKSAFRSLNSKDLLGLLIFILIPLGFFVSNFISEYRLIYYAILLIFVVIYALVGQFFYEDQRMTNLGRRLIALTIVNTVIISFVNMTGNLESPYFFILYFLTFAVSIAFPAEVILLECLVIFLSVLVAEFHEFDSITLLFSSISSNERAALLSLPISFPLILGISVFVQRLTVKQRLLEASRNLLAIQDIEGEALLSEIDQGILMLDAELKIVKVSHWIEVNLNATSRILLGHAIQDIAFYDAVTNKRFNDAHSFYKNLTSPNPQKLNWRVMYKNQYGKFIKLVIKQNPLIVQNRVIGFLLVVRHPPKSIEHVMASFNQLFNFRLSSGLAVLKNLFTQSQTMQKDPKAPAINKQLNLITMLLNDTSVKNQISEGNLELSVKNTDVQALLASVTGSLKSVGTINVWNVSPAFKNKPIIIETDATWCGQFLRYALLGALYLDRAGKVSVSIDEDTVTNRPMIIMSANVKTEFTERVDVLEPFFAGKLMILSKYAGTGLEISNANLLAKFLGFDFNAEISNNTLVIKIIF